MVDPIRIPSHRAISARARLPSLSPTVDKPTVFSCSPGIASLYGGKTPLDSGKTPRDRRDSDLEARCASPAAYAALTDREEDMPHARRELKRLGGLSFPIAVTYVLEILPVVVSIMLVGKLDSPLATEFVGGATLSSMVISLTGEVVGSGLATALDTLCSQAHGAGKPEKIGVYFQTGLLVLFVAYLPAFLINWHTETLLTWIQQPAELATLAGRFSRLLLPGLPFMYVYELIKKALQAQNIVAPMVCIAVFGNVVNVTLGIYLTWYTPLGFSGAAIARFAAYAVQPLATIPYFLWKPQHFHMWWHGWQPRAALRHIRVFLSLGLPGMLMIVLENLSYNIVAVLVAYLPNSVIAINVHSVLYNVVNIAFRLYLGLAIATNVVVGNYVGGGQRDHAKMASNLGMMLSLALALGVVTIIASAHNQLPRLFVNDDETIAQASTALLYLIPFQLLDAANCVMQGIFRGTGRQTFAAVVNLVSLFVVGLPCRYLFAFPLDLGVEGMWHGLTVGYVCCVAVSLFKIVRTDWDAMVEQAQKRMA